jgi:xylulokinase
VYLGTSGWIATLSRDVLARPGVFNLAAIPPDLYINVVPFLNAGGVHKWISGVLGAEGAGLNFYDHTDSLLEKSEPGSGGLLFLPYLSGERFPVMDPKIRGAYVGLGNETGPAQMARACLEGVAFSIRQGLEAIDPGGAEKISLIGGGAKTPVWRQILADALQSPVTVLGDHSEYLPSIALAGAVFIDQGLAGSYEEFAASLGASRENRRYVPGAPEIMETQYRRYLKLYPALKGLF